MRPDLLLAVSTSVLLVLVATGARAITFGDGNFHRIDATNSFPFEGVTVKALTSGQTSLLIVTGGQIGSLGLGTISEFLDNSRVLMSGGSLFGEFRISDMAEAKVSGGSITGRIVMHGSSSLRIDAGVFSLDSLEVYDRAVVDMLGGELSPGIDMHGRSFFRILAGVVEGTVSASDRAGLHVWGGEIRGTVSASGSSSLDVQAGLIGSYVQLDDGASMSVRGGSVGDGSSSVRVNEAAKMVVSGGELIGDVIVNQGGVVSISGGAVLGTLLALDDSAVVFVGSDFNSPFGELTATNGTLRGTLSDGSPLDAPFGRASTASIQLICPGVGSISPTTSVLAASQNNYCEDWSGASQPGDDLSNAGLELVRLSSANLAGAVLESADLRDADLSSADLGGAVFDDADLTNADLSAANLSGVSLSGARLTGAKYDDATQFPSGNPYDAPPWGLPGGESPWALGMKPAGALSDSDLDLVPDRFDNCVLDANGPNQANYQVDGDLDGYGNACDADYDNNRATDGRDFAMWIAAFNSLNAVVDLTGDGVVNGSDFLPFISSFNNLPGPSGLPCAGTIPCTP